MNCYYYKSSLMCSAGLFFPYLNMMYQLTGFTALVERDCFFWHVLYLIACGSRWMGAESSGVSSNESVRHAVLCFRWVLKQLYDKGLVYRGVKVMPFSTACNTPLSNFEAQQNYKVRTKLRCSADLQRVWQTLSSSRDLLCSAGRAGSVCDRELPSAGGRGGELPRLHHHAMDPAQQPGPLRQPRLHLRQGQRSSLDYKNHFIYRSTSRYTEQIY